ncbi:MAG: hypothetical protein A2Y89_00080 [Chloroflexi bacterium RBG_13_51_18]|nr:MAG: hypothetical protein A2Y89_00080 [Chloroflexi bacterium RBG_13_51_18]
MDSLGAYPPSPELAKNFLAQYSNRKAPTLYRYAQMIKNFMKWYGEPIDDVKIKVPKTLPPYTEDSNVEKVLAVIPKKRSHKGCIERDQLMVLLDWRACVEQSWLIFLSGTFMMAQWRREYNQVRPHSALGYRPPAPEAILTGATS